MWSGKERWEWKLWLACKAIKKLKQRKKKEKSRVLVCVCVNILTQFLMFIKRF